MRIILIDPEEGRREVLARRLRAQGYSVEVAPDAASGANRALAAPPAAVIADLWMTGISGVQLCRLLSAEPATCDVPVILRGADESPRSRFWAYKAGAACYVLKGRMGELLRTLSRVAIEVDEGCAFFTQLNSESLDIRDRIADHLDQALFDSVLASEVRALTTCGSVERLFDLFSQLFCQLTPYNWLAMHCDAPARLGVHLNPACSEAAIAAVRRLVDCGDLEIFAIEDEDARPESCEVSVVRAPIMFGALRIGELLMQPLVFNIDDQRLLNLAGVELGGALRIAVLVEESQRLACTDSLTGLGNRRAFTARLGEMRVEQALGKQELAVVLMDIDRFKLVNDRQGHAVGDKVLAGLGSLLGRLATPTCEVARWGGEEFVVGLQGATREEARAWAEDFRLLVKTLEVVNRQGELVPVTVSLGVSFLHSDDSLDSLIDRADRCMYLSKTTGRDRVTLEGDSVVQTRSRDDRAEENAA
jgi:diguanylate cyclase (GGDEF)-like protein